MKNNYGNYVDYEFILSRKAGNSLYLCSYLAKYEIAPVRYTFIFYKPESDFKLLSISLDTDTNRELLNSSDLVVSQETYNPK
ncbi:hypothetical protein [Marinigracilibium pacificum]|uniref:Uncharacterized protein n=1 Tax=Marinigracilibium pacificum TaxID=2729599 RepID=A0A848IUT5_9BACT|nr:hypothetical protein [Marinigracilibium pacificum]NMM48097.1 hypothetical protein [Marinigracilibium pacificum]